MAQAITALALFGATAALTSPSRRTRPVRADGVKVTTMRPNPEDLSAGDRRRVYGYRE